MSIANAYQAQNIMKEKYKWNIIQNKTKCNKITILIPISPVPFWSCTAVPSQEPNPRLTEHPEDQLVAENEPARLNCKAEGTPPPIISWYKDGQELETLFDNPSSQLLILPDGELFFLNVSSPKVCFIY